MNHEDIVFRDRYKHGLLLERKLAVFFERLLGFIMARQKTRGNISVDIEIAVCRSYRETMQPLIIQQ